MKIFSIFSSRWGPIITGAFIGVMAAILVQLGNPGNMGICVACFTRDISGALGFHAAKFKYIRPEIIGFILGAFGAALLFREFKPRAGSAPIIRFFLGVFAVIGALVFLGCPWRALLRLAGGDLNAVVGLVGLVVGIFIGTMFLRFGFSLGPNKPTSKFAGLIIPIFAVVLLLFLLLEPTFGKAGSAPIYLNFNISHAKPIIISLIAGLLVGFLAQRSRFCTVGAFRDMFILRDMHLLWGVIALVGFAIATNLIFTAAGDIPRFRIGFEGQPAAHTMHLWNFSGMVLAGLAFTLAGGCPGRQVFLSGEGDSDAGIFFLGMLVGAGIAHNYNLASSGKGIGFMGAESVIVGLVFCLLIGFTMREKFART